jgi:hypothetical protein
MLSPQVFVGIDVAKAQLDIALRPIGTCWTVSNDDVGIADLVTRLQGIGPQLIVLEATGGFQRAVVAALAAAALPVVVVNPRQARDFAKATGQVAKTRMLHASQFVCPVWYHFPRDSVTVVYEDKQGQSRLTTVATGEDCREVSEGRVPFEELANRVQFIPHADGN